jgi:hypothetical protein
MQKNSRELSERIANCLPAGTFELEIFCQLVGIEASRKIESAAVQGSLQPRMLINPDFVEKYCQRDEHLFLLVMHELWHILLGHTRLFPRATLIDNIAFDAIINAALTLQFAEAEYRGFLEEINSAEKFPSLLLRSPHGWPDRTVFQKNMPPGTAEILGRLYHPHRKGGEFAEPLYEEIRQLLLQNQPGEQGKIRLLGNHADPNEGSQGDNFVRDVLREVTRKWPKSPIPVRGRGTSKEPGSWSSLVGEANPAGHRVFARVVRKLALKARNSSRRRGRKVISITGGRGVLPNPRDRMWEARQRLGLSQVLWQQPVEMIVRTTKRVKVVVYLDVSGSMFDHLPDLIGLLIPVLRRKEILVYQFSGVVLPLSLADLQVGHLGTSRGTDINCVLEHILNMGVRAAVILTDGYTGTAQRSMLRMLEDNQVHLHFVLPYGSGWQEEVSVISQSVTILPDLSR